MPFTAPKCFFSHVNGHLKHYAKQKEKKKIAFLLRDMNTAHNFK